MDEILVDDDLMDAVQEGEITPETAAIQQLSRDVLFLRKHADKVDATMEDVKGAAKKKSSLKLVRRSEEA